MVDVEADKQAKTGRRVYRIVDFRRDDYYTPDEVNRLLDSSKQTGGLISDIAAYIKTKNWLSRDDDMADDVAIEVVLKWINLPEAKRTGRILPLIIKQKVFEHIKRRKKQPVCASEVPHGADDADKASNWMESVPSDTNEVASVIEDIAERQYKSAIFSWLRRNVGVKVAYAFMMNFEGISFSEAAILLHVPAPTLRKQVDRARDKLAASELVTELRRSRHPP
jgi:DNA-directed RNA polymerase specialized sigma24 family protein